LNNGETASIAGTLAQTQPVGALRLPRTTIALVTVAAVLVCSVHAAVAESNTIQAAGIGYLCFALVMLGCSFAFWTRARSAAGPLRVRWSLIAAATLTASIAYLPSFTQFILKTPPQRVFQVVSFNTVEALYLLAAVMFFAGVARTIVLADTLQVLLFILLRFNVIYSPANSDHFTINHLIIEQIMALFLFVVALVACLGAASRAEVNFLRTLSLYFGLRLVGLFLSNQVSYTWLHYTNCGLLDVVAFALLAGFSLYLLYTRRWAETDAVNPAPRAASVLVRSLMPSFLALANLLLSLFLLRISATLAAVAMSATLLCYLVRTVLLQAQAMREKMLLETHNEHLEGLAIRDPLTGIGNRRSMANVYRRLQTEGGGLRVSLLVIDIDQFKQVNDLYGHQHGDTVLITLAGMLERIAANVVGSHSVRMGGDEFALLLPDVTPETALDMAESLRAAFGAHRFEAGDSRGSLSIGIASLESARDLPLETLVCEADEALYRAKELGRNRVEAQPVWEPKAAIGAPAHGVRLKLQHNHR